MLRVIREVHDDKPVLVIATLEKNGVRIDLVAIVERSRGEERESG